MPAKRRLNQTTAAGGGNNDSGGLQHGRAPSAHGTAHIGSAEGHLHMSSKGQRGSGDQAAAAHHVVWSAADVTAECHVVMNGRPLLQGRGPAAQHDIHSIRFSERMPPCRMENSNPHVIFALPKAVAGRPHCGDCDQTVNRPRSAASVAESTADEMFCVCTLPNVTRCNCNDDVVGVGITDPTPTPTLL